ncbi:MAG: type II transport protein [Halioglobus sp.]|nr:type II transport protein [Halioglobus sp.]
MDRMFAVSGWRGFTLVEMLVVLLVAALTLAVAAPLLTNIALRARVGVEATRLLLAINLARSEAVLRGTRVTLCPSSVARDGEATCAGHFAQGWMIFANADRDVSADAERDELLHVFPAVPSGFSVRNMAGTRNADRSINFLPDGTSHSNQTLMVCPPAGSAVTPRGVVISIAGRARLREGNAPCMGV